MKATLIYLILCLLPWTLKAQDSTWVPGDAAIKVYPIGRSGYWEKHPPDSLRIHPEPWPDSELVALVKHLVDSALAQVGHWEARVHIFVGPRAAPDVLRMPSDSCVTGYECWRDTTWVWVKGAKP